MLRLLAAVSDMIYPVFLWGLHMHDITLRQKHG